MNWFLVYSLLHLVPTVGAALITIGILVIVLGLIVFCSSFFGGSGSGQLFNGDKDGVARKATRKSGKRSLIVGIVFCLLGSLIPSKETVVLCYVIPAVVNSELAQDIPEDLRELYTLGIEELKDSVAGVPVR